MGFFKSLFGPKETEEERLARLAATREERATKYLAGVGVEALAQEYGMTNRGVMAELARRGIYKFTMTPERGRTLLEAAIASAPVRSERVIISTDGLIALALSTTKLQVYSVSGQEAQCKDIAPSGLSSVQLLVDDESVLTTTGTTELGNAIVGGLLFGGVGAVVGGIVGQNTTAQRSIIRKLEIKLAPSSVAVDPIRVQLLDSPIDSKSPKLLQLRANAENWIDWLTAFMASAPSQRTKRESGKSRSPRPAKAKAESDVGSPGVVTGASVADELSKLHALKEAGAITAAEFESFKSALLRKLGAS